jgi:hypothetical protein
VIQSVRLIIGLMMQQKTTFIISLLVFLSTNGPLAALAPDHERLMTSIRKLTEHPTRVTGSEGSAQTADDIEAAFSALELTNVVRQPFTTIVPQTHHATLSIGPESFTVHPVWPNGMRTATTGSVMHGPVLWVGEGQIHNYNGHKVDGAIVFLEGDSGVDWFHAPMLGAAAVVFVESERMTRPQAELKFSTAPIATPRYWMRKKAAYRIRDMVSQANMDGHQLLAEWSSRVDWNEVESSNIFAYLPGSDPSWSDRTIVLAANYDGMSIVPDVAPAAESAINTAILLDLARQLKEAPPRCSVLFAAFGGHNQALKGAREFADAWRWSQLDLDAKRSDLQSDVDRLLPAYRNLREAVAALLGFADSEKLEADIRSLESERSRRRSQYPTLARIRLALTSLKADAERGGLVDELEEARSIVDVIEAREIRANKSRLQLIRLNRRKEFTGKFGHDRLRDLTFFFSIDLSSHSSTVGLFFKGRFVDQFEKNYETTVRENVSPLSFELAGAADSIRAVLPNPATWVDGVNDAAGMTWRTHVKVAVALDAEMVSLAGLSSATFLTAEDPRLWVDTPMDLVDRLDAENIARQSELLYPVIKTLLNKDQALQILANAQDHKLLSPERFRRIYGRAVEYDPAKSLGAADQPVPNALMTLQHNPGYWNRRHVQKAYAGVRAQDLIYADEGGFYEFIGIPDKKARWWDTWWYALEGYKFNPSDGEITYAPDRGQFVNQKWKKNQSIQPITQEKDVTSVMFRADPMTIFDMMDQRTFDTFVTLEIYDGASGTLPLSWGYKVAGKVTQKTYREPAGTIFASPGMRPKVRFGMGSNQNVGNKYPLLNVTGSDSDPIDGIGYDIPESNILSLTPLKLASDIWTLDEARLTKLRKHGIRSDHLDELHQKAGDHLEKAKQALSDLRYDAFLRHANASWSYEAKAYPHVKGTTADVLIGVLLYLFLLIPFSFFAERLFFGFTNVNAQIAGFAGFFVATFGILSLVHPAFSLTNAAPVILLAFITLALSVAVIGMIRGRFEIELYALQKRPGTGERTDFSRLSAARTAFLLGINNMRRRKVRTGLTIATLVLVMFSVLSLSSIESRLIILKRSVDSGGNTPPYEGALVRMQNWYAISGSAYENLRIAFPASEGHVLAPRSWIVSQSANVSAGVPVRRADGGDTVFRLTGLVGMMPEEDQATGVDQHLLHGRWFQPDDRLACVLPQKVFEHLGLAWTAESPTYVRTLSHKLEVVGVFSDVAITDWRDADTEPLSPVDYSVENWQKHEGTDLGASADVYHYVHLDPRNVAYLPYDLLNDHGAELRSVAVLPAASVSLDEAAEERLMKKLEIPIFFSSGGQVVFASSGKGMAITGMLDLLVPIFIAALIVLNTMLGSVYERESEISIYGAMGLAPIHISSLFIAESCVYASLSTVGGYVLGQVIAKTITAQGLLGGLSLNYSSSAAAFAAIAIGSVVMLSTIYPARRAAALSVPDVERIWRVPPANGDVLDIPFPFTINVDDAVGLNAYLLFFFRDHSRQSIGEFYTSDNRLTHEEHPGGTGYRLTCDVWIAPFDFGISQSVELFSRPSEDAGIYETAMTITRKSGNPQSWETMNNRFLKAIRKQFLLWRTLDPSERAFYRNEADREVNDEVATT